jgi:hypothetical protein
MSDVQNNQTPSQSAEVDEIRTIEALEARTFGNRFLHFNPQFTLLRKGFALSIQLIDLLGSIAPTDNYDRTQRDLACDTLDSLWLAEHALLRGYENQALSLLRRGYETTSLMAFFVNYPGEVGAWENSKKIPQVEIRKKLETAPFREPKENLDEMYRVYSLFTHVNRETVYHRMLGEGNRLTLGSQGNSGDDIVGSVLRELLRQMMWFVDVTNFTFAKLGLRPEKQYVDEMLAYRDEVQGLAKKLPALFAEFPKTGSPASPVP